jgi:hypothetical protein
LPVAHFWVEIDTQARWFVTAEVDLASRGPGGVRPFAPHLSALAGAKPRASLWVDAGLLQRNVVVRDGSKRMAATSSRAVPEADSAASSSSRCL